MKHLYAIAAREIAERRALFALGLAVGLVPFLWPLNGFGGRVDREIFAAVTIDSFLLGAAALCGASVIGRDLAENRLGFYFVRPVPWWSIWGGKMLAAVGLALGSALLVALPVILVDGGAAPVGHPFAIALAVLAAVLFVAVGHAASVAYRANSPLLILDLVLAPVVFGSGLMLVKRLVAQKALAPHGWVPFPMSIFVLAGAVSFAFLAAGAVQVRQGRTDPRRGHKALSLTLWLLLGTIVAALFGYGEWVRP
jgi:hypothetical protein